MESLFKFDLETRRTTFKSLNHSSFHIMLMFERQILKDLEIFLVGKISICKIESVTFFEEFRWFV